jgi:hypothetical protein
MNSFLLKAMSTAGFQEESSVQLCQLEDNFHQSTQQNNKSVTYITRTK